MLPECLHALHEIPCNIINKMNGRFKMLRLLFLLQSGKKISILAPISSIMYFVNNYKYHLKILLVRIDNFLK